MNYNDRAEEQQLREVLALSTRTSVCMRRMRKDSVGGESEVRSARGSCSRAE